MSTVFIYGLNDPITGRARYVGMSQNPFHRYEQHEEVAKRGKHRAHVYFWWRKLLTTGRSPVLEVLDEVPKTEWQFWEREYIRLFRMLFPDLTNHAKGGQGGHGKHDEETKKKIGDANRGQKRSPELRARIGSAQKGRKQSPETVAKRAASLRAHHVKRRAAGLPVNRPASWIANNIAAGARRRGKCSSAQLVHLRALAQKRTGIPLSAEHRANVSAAKKGLTSRHASAIVAL